MNEILMIVLALIAGVVLGIIFFYGLWLTVKKAMTAKIPALWILGSFLIRTSVTLLGIYYVGNENINNYIICGVGFVIGRYMVRSFTKRYQLSIDTHEKMIQINIEKTNFKKEVGHAS